MTHGGARQGAGAPEGSRPGTATERHEIRLTTHEKQVLRRRAAARGMTVSEFIKVQCLSGKEDCDVVLYDTSLL